MPQLNLYLDPETQKRAKEAASRSGLSLSGWVRNQISEVLDSDTKWPDGYAGLFGSLKHLEVDSIRQDAKTVDIPREPL
ncbi:MAG: hypothetical protein MK080_02880 [Opitutales bacterium]|nr:hypothetical protein [Opitutales bacterium]NRA26046.1 toxin-antitoxin system, antitoxin component [Opitutales bacterium]